MKIKIRNKFKFIYAIVIIIVLITLVITLIVTNIKNKSIDTAIKETKVEENIALANATLYNIKENINSRLNDWKLILVNKENYLPDNYEVNLKTINGNMKVDERIYNDLKNMLNELLAKLDRRLLELEKHVASEKYQDILEILTDYLFS